MEKDTDKVSVASRLAKLNAKAAEDQKLSAVLQSLETSVPDLATEKERPRLRVPYATAVPTLPG